MENITGLFFYLILLGGLFYFLLIRPQQMRTKKHQELVKSLKNGDKVMTIGGIIGRIKSIDEELIKLEIAEKVIIKVSKSAITKII